MGIGIVGAGGILLQKLGHGLRMLVGKGLAHQQARRDQAAVHAQLVPLSGEIQGHPQPLHLALGHGDKGLGQHGHGGFLLGHEGHDLRGLALPLHGDVFAQGQAVLSQQVGQGILGSGALAGGVDGFAGQGLDIRHGLAALFHNVQHAQGAGGQKLHLALGLVVEDGAHIGGHGQNIQLALDQLRCQLRGGGGHGELIGVGGQLVFSVVQQLGHAHGGGALQATQTDVYRLVCFLAGLRGAGGQAQCQHQGQQEGEDLFHCGVPFFCFSFPQG